MMIRKATEDDFEAIRAIYNYEVETACNNFAIHPADAETWAEHMAGYNKPGGNHPLIVADDREGVCGYASLSAFRSKGGYAPAVELSIYISPDHRGQGIGGKLMAAIIDEARANQDTHAVISVITEGNKASIALHEKFGFEYCGSMKEIAFKHGAYRDMSFYELLV